MPLIHNAIYTIRNDLTHTVLDFADPAGNDVFARGWGWHGRVNQQWKLFQVDADAHTWRLQNQRDDTSRRFLARQDNQNNRLVGIDAANVNANSTFIIQRIPGPSERYKISIANNGPVVVLSTGENVADFDQANRVQDLEADGPPLALRDEGGAVVSIWSFLPVAQLPVEDGDYQITNSRTGTALDLQSGDPNATAQGQASENTFIQKWVVKKDPNGDGYTFNSFRNAADRFLAPLAAAGAGVALRGQGAPQFFTVRKVPREQLYKIFLGRLAVNLAVLGNGAPDPANGTAITLQAANAQTWNFLSVSQLENGTYQIINNVTGTALDLQSDAADAPAQGRTSDAAQGQKWVVTKDPNGDGYTFNSSRSVDDRFLAPSVAAAVGVALRGQEATQSFIVRKVPGQKLYKIFLGRLAVNLAVLGNGAPDPANGTAITLQDAVAQWSFRQ